MEMNVKREGKEDKLKEEEVEECNEKEQRKMA